MPSPSRPETRTDDANDDDVDLLSPLPGPVASPPSFSAVLTPPRIGRDPLAPSPSPSSFKPSSPLSLSEWQARRPVLSPLRLPPFSPPLDSPSMSPLPSPSLAASTSEPAEVVTVSSLLAGPVPLGPEGNVSHGRRQSMSGKGEERRHVGKARGSGAAVQAISTIFLGQPSARASVVTTRSHRGWKGKGRERGDAQESYFSAREGSRRWLAKPLLRRLEDDEEGNEVYVASTRRDQPVFQLRRRPDPQQHPSARSPSTPFPASSSAAPSSSLSSDLGDRLDADAVVVLKSSSTVEPALSPTQPPFLRPRLRSAHTAPAPSTSTDAADSVLHLFGPQEHVDTPPSPVPLPGAWMGSGWASKLWSGPKSAGERGRTVSADAMTRDVEGMLVLPPPMLDETSDAASFEGILGIRRARAAERARRRMERKLARNQPAHKVGMLQAVANFVVAARAAERAVRDSKRRAIEKEEVGEAVAVGMDDEEAQEMQRRPTRLSDSVEAGQPLPAFARSGGENGAGARVVTLSRSLSEKRPARSNSSGGSASSSISDQLQGHTRTRNRSSSTSNSTPHLRTFAFSPVQRAIGDASVRASPMRALSAVALPSQPLSRQASLRAASSALSSSSPISSPEVFDGVVFDSASPRAPRLRPMNVSMPPSPMTPIGFWEELATSSSSTPSHLASPVLASTNASAATVHVDLPDDTATARAVAAAHLVASVSPPSPLTPLLQPMLDDGVPSPFDIAAEAASKAPGARLQPTVLEFPPSPLTPLAGRLHGYPGATSSPYPRTKLSSGIGLGVNGLDDAGHSEENTPSTTQSDTAAPTAGLGLDAEDRRRLAQTVVSFHLREPERMRKAVAASALAAVPQHSPASRLVPSSMLSTAPEDDDQPTSTRPSSPADSRAGALRRKTSHASDETLFSSSVLPSTTTPSLRGRSTPPPPHPSEGGDAHWPLRSMSHLTDAKNVFREPDSGAFSTTDSAILTALLSVLSLLAQFVFFVGVHVFDLVRDAGSGLFTAAWFGRWLFLNVTGQTVLGRAAFDCYRVIYREWEAVAFEDHEAKGKKEGGWGAQPRGLTKWQVARGMAELVAMHVVTRQRYLRDGAGLVPLKGWEPKWRRRRRSRMGDEEEEEEGGAENRSEALDLADEEGESEEEDSSEDEEDYFVTRRGEDILELEFTKTPRPDRPGPHRRATHFGVGPGTGTPPSSSSSSPPSICASSTALSEDTATLIRTIKRNARLAISTYGLHRYIYEPPTPLFTPSGKRFANHTFSFLSRIDKDDVVHAGIQTLDGNAEYSPTFFICVDTSRKAVVVAIRGSQSLSDIIVDLDIFTERVYLPPVFGEGDDNVEARKREGEEELRSHAGVLRAARNLINPSSELFVKLRETLEANRGFTIVLTGHSLGGALCSTIALLLSEFKPTPDARAGEKRGRRRRSSRGTEEEEDDDDDDDDDFVPGVWVTSSSSGLPPGRLIRAVTFAHPATGSVGLARRASLGTVPLVVSVVLGSDIVARMGHGQIRELRRALGALSRVRRRKEVDDLGGETNAAAAAAAMDPEESDSPRVHILRAWHAWRKLSRSERAEDKARRGEIEEELWKLRREVEGDLFASAKARARRPSLVRSSEGDGGRGVSPSSPSPDKKVSSSVTATAWSSSASALHRLSARRMALETATMRGEEVQGGPLIPIGAVYWLDGPHSEGELSLPSSGGKKAASSTTTTTMTPSSSSPARESGIRGVYRVTNPVAFFSLPDFQADAFASHFPAAYQDACRQL